MILRLPTYLRSIQSVLASFSKLFCQASWFYFFPEKLLLELPKKSYSSCRASSWSFITCPSPTFTRKYEPTSVNLEPWFWSIIGSGYPGKDTEAHSRCYRSVSRHNPFEPPHDKTNKMTCAPCEDSDQPGHLPSLIRVFAVHTKKAWVLSYPLSAQRRLWSDLADA